MNKQSKIQPNEIVIKKREINSVEAKTLAEFFLQESISDDGQEQLGADAVADAVMDIYNFLIADKTKTINLIELPDKYDYNIMLTEALYNDMIWKQGIRKVEECMCYTIRKLYITKDGKQITDYDLDMDVLYPKYEYYLVD